MFNSTVLEVAIGMTFCYASISLVSSSIKEALSTILSWRSETLLTGIQSLLNDKTFTGLARDIYNHALVNPLSNGQAIDTQSLQAKPAYIEPANFAQAMIDTLQSAPNNFAQLELDIEKIPDPQIKNLLLTLYRNSDHKIENFHQHLATWFDNSMERLTGKYKRNAQWVCFTIAFIIALSFNIDSIYLFKTLWEHPAYIAQLNIQSAESLNAVITNLQQLPIGWNRPEIHDFFVDEFWTDIEIMNFGKELIFMLIGWLITASASLFGAPFWFDALQNLINLRGTGKKPQTT